MTAGREFDAASELERTGAVRRGHFKLSSGRHSDTYVQCSSLLREPELAVRAGEALAELAPLPVDLVLSPAIGALLIGFTTALALGVPMVFAEREGGALKLRRGFELPPGSRILLVEDVMTTGGSVLELARMVQQAGAEVAALACIVDRRPAGAEAPYAVVSLTRLEADSWLAEECPLCDRGVPVEAPGSRFTG